MTSPSSGGPRLNAAWAGDLALTLFLALPLGLWIAVDPRVHPGWSAVVVVGASLYLTGRWKRAHQANEHVEALTPEERAVLERHVGYFARLSPEEAERFCGVVARFLRTQRIQGVGVEPEVRDRVYVAASAAILTFGYPAWRWDTLRDILLYPSAFRDEWEERLPGELLGLVADQGPVIFSVEDLRAGYEDGDNGENVGLHEFAHLLDFQGGAIDGAPSALDAAAEAEWVDAMLAILQSPRASERVAAWLGHAAVESESEFFAHLTEVFFEAPDTLHAALPSTYRALCALYRQDPLARWLESTGEDPQRTQRHARKWLRAQVRTANTLAGRTRVWRRRMGR